MSGPANMLRGEAELRVGGEGEPRAWYVRLWNYAVGDPEDAAITLDFDAMDGGYLLPDEADPVTHYRRVVAVDGRAVTLDAPVAADSMAFGELLWIEGAASGLASPVIGGGGTALQLAEVPAVLPELPARTRLTEGCDKQLVTCRARFGNAMNFRGEAHLPGNDLLTRYPGG